MNIKENDVPFSDNQPILKPSEMLSKTITDDDKYDWIAGMEDELGDDECDDEYFGCANCRINFYYKLYNANPDVWKYAVLFL
jgi:hypothetical protein